ncbi:STAS domain-containing protein [Amycolatopsis sp. NPDC004368]
MTAGPFTVQASSDPSGATLAPHGELDIATSPTFVSHIEAATLEPGGLFVLDLSEVTFCDSSGVSALLAARNVAHAADAAIALVGVPAHLTRTLGLIGLASAFPTYATAEQAREART